MSENGKINITGKEEESFVEVSPVKKTKILEKKIPTAIKNGKVGKSTKHRTVSSRLKAKQPPLTRAVVYQKRQSNDSFYQGALLGSFLGATLSTVITNAIARLLG